MFRVAIESDRMLAPWGESLAAQDKRALLSPLVRGLVRRVRAASESLKDLRLWHVNSTARGGGVAEMLPRFVFALRELGVATEWLVLSPAADKRAAFFSLTKHLHNNIHGDGVSLGAWAGCGRERAEPGRPANEEELATCSAEQRERGLAAMRALMSEVCEEAASVFFQSFCPQPDAARDVVGLHDPQPLARVVALKARCPGLRVVWRSHIGLDAESDVTREVWDFLAPWVDACDKLVFSNALYVPSRWRDKAVIIAPGIAPISNKNRDLSAFEVTQVLTRAGLIGYESRTDVAAPRGCELIDPAFSSLAKIYGSGGSGDGGACTACEGVVAPSSAIPFLHRPVVLQVSRFDRLKGFRSLLLAFCDLKERPEHYAAIPGLPAASAAAAAAAAAASTQHEPPLFSHRYAPGSGDGSDDAASSPRLSVRPHDHVRHAKMIRAAVLVLAGPDPGGVSDDPEALEVLEELKRLHDALPRDVADDIKIVELPMGNTLENALCVNALQRASIIVVQNSIREGFGLTVAEAQCAWSLARGCPRAYELARLPNRQPRPRAP